QQPIMAVAGVGIERHIAQDAAVELDFLDRTRRPADQILRVQRLAAVVRLAPFFRVRKKREHRYTKPCRFARRLGHQVDADAFDARHRADRHALVAAVGQKDRPDQVRGRQRVLLHKAARPGGARLRRMRVAGKCACAFIGIKTLASLTRTLAPSYHRAGFEETPPWPSRLTKNNGSSKRPRAFSPRRTWRPLPPSG